MAVMSPTEVRNGNVSFGDMKGKIVDFAIGTYATSGLAVDPHSFGMNSLLGVQIVGGNAASGKYQYAYDTVNKKLLVYRIGVVAGTVAAPTFTGDALTAHRHTLHLNQADVVDGAGTRVNAATNLLGANSGADVEVAGVADASGHGGIIDASGGTPTGTNSAPAFTGGAAGPLTEVSNGVDLSLITVRLLGMGF